VVPQQVEGTPTGAGGKGARWLMGNRGHGGVKIASGESQEGEKRVRTVN
jgi:hypothetical protein